MSDFLTTAWAGLGIIFLYSVLLLFLQIDLGPSATITGGIGLGVSVFVGIGLLLFYGLPPDAFHFAHWFFGGFISVMAVVVVLYSLRWILVGT